MPFDFKCVCESTANGKKPLGRPSVGPRSHSVSQQNHEERFACYCLLLMLLIAVMMRGLQGDITRFADTVQHDL